MIFLLSSRKTAFLFPENMIFFYGRKIKDRLSQKNTWKYYVFCMFYKDGVCFFYKYEITLCEKSKGDLFPKNTRKMTFPALLKKMIFIIEKMMLTFQIDILERVPMILCTFMETFLSVFIYCFPIKKPRKLNIQD